VRDVIEWAAPAALIVVFVVAAGLPLLIARARHADLWQAAYATAVDVALVASLAVVLALTIVFEEGGPDQVRLVPFSNLVATLAIGDRESVREALVDIVLNTALFVPLGVAVALRSRRPSWSRFVLAIGLLSVTIEITQAVALRGRTADTTDVLTNVWGALLGFAAGVTAVTWLSRHFRPGHSRTVA
jgi:glycopeptide antibiotics resistance protein